MPTGKISKVVHLSLQSAGSADCSPAPKGYGYLLADDADNNSQPLYFEAKAVQRYDFDQLQPGQAVEFDADPKLPVAKNITPVGEIVSAPRPQLDLP